MNLRKRPEEIKADVEFDVKMTSELSKNLQKLKKIETKLNQARFEYGEKVVPNLLSKSDQEIKTLRSSVIIGRMGFTYKHLAQTLEKPIENLQKIENAPLNISKLYGKESLKKMNSYVKDKNKADKELEKFKKNGNEEAFKKKLIEFSRTEEEYLGLLQREYEARRVEEMTLLFSNFVSNELNYDSETLNCNTKILETYANMDISKEANFLTMSYFEKG